MPDCERCPLSWEDWSYDRDRDCGCVACPDMDRTRPVCLLPTWAKRAIRKYKDKKLDQAMAHEGEDMLAWFQEQERNGDND